MVSALIDLEGVNGASAELWRRKATKYVHLVDTAEAGASRAMSDLHRNALDMAREYQKLDEKSEQSEALSNRVKIHRIIR